MTLAGCTNIFLAPSIVAPCPNPSSTAGQLISRYIQPQPWVTSPSLLPLFCKTSSPLSLAPFGPLLHHPYHHYPTNGTSATDVVQPTALLYNTSFSEAIRLQPKYKPVQTTTLYHLSGRTVQASYICFWHYIMSYLCELGLQFMNNCQLPSILLLWIIILSQAMVSFIFELKPVIWFCLVWVCQMPCFLRFGTKQQYQIETSHLLCM